MKKIIKNTLGFTLIEILIGIVISSIMMAAMFTSYTVVKNSYSKVTDVANISRAGRDIISMMMRDIRMAGFIYYYGLLRSVDPQTGETKLIESHVEVNDSIVESVVKNASELKCPVLVHAEDYQECECGIKTAKEKTNKIKEDAGLVGTVVHGLIEDFLKGKDIPKQSDPAVVNCWNLFLDWWNKQEYEVVELEKKIYSKKYNYAGTLDLVVKDKKGNLVLIDIKTSNHITYDYFLQLNAYRFAYEEETKSKISKAFIVRLPKKESEIEIKEIPLNNKLFNAFVGAKWITTTMESIEY